jgi:hypothetical protein
MLTTLHAVVHGGKIELSEPAELVDGTRLLVTVLRDEDRQFWLGVSQHSLAAIWDNTEDDIYAELLEK